MAIGCAAVLAIDPKRQISVNIKSEWSNLFGKFRESPVEKSMRIDEWLKIQMTWVESDETNAWSENNLHENARKAIDIGDETSVEFNEPNKQSEETQPITDGAFDEVNAQSLFDKFKADYKRQYASTEELGHRYNIFKQNLLRIQELNNNPSGTATYGIGEFADLTTTEFQRQSNWVQFADDELPPFNDTIEIRDTVLASSFDWRLRKVITRVKQQGNCSSGWAFGAVGAIEAMHALKTNRLEDFSEQQLVDCDTANNGCRGGNPMHAFETMHVKGGLEAERDYPYRAQRLHCRFDKRFARVQLSGAKQLPRNEEKIAQYLTQHGPVVMGINDMDMHHYRSGIAQPSPDQCPRDRVNHYVLAVGYGIGWSRSGQSVPYWVVKNSRGACFGERGYYKIYRGNNSCGVNLFTSIVALQ